MYYAGIGSRDTPETVCQQMTELATELESFGLTLRSGGADGADAAFEKGAIKTAESYRVSGLLINGIYIKYKDKSLMDRSVAKYHPVPDKLKGYVRGLMARNYCQLYGPAKGSGKSKFVVCWTADGTIDNTTIKTGGTGQAIRIAVANNIPVFNLKRKKEIDRLKSWLTNDLRLKYKWARKGGYECSSKGDKSFSALFAVLKDQRTIEQHYQCDVKGYDPGGTKWKLGKGKGPADEVPINLWASYLELWKKWAKTDQGAIDLARLASVLKKDSGDYNNTVSDTFANTPISQARALACLLNERRYQILSAK